MWRWMMNQYELPLRTVRLAITPGCPAYNHNVYWYRRSTFEPLPFRSASVYLVSSGKSENLQTTAGNVRSGKDDVLPTRFLRDNPTESVARL